jgi:hypothetical protein
MVKVFLNMIVKNEGKIIERLLESCLKIISGCIITDTGSSDNTKEIIKSFCIKNNMYCEIKDEEFINFEHARNKSLMHARNSEAEFDYILLLDADHTLVIRDNFDLNDLKEPVYLLSQGNDSFFYSNIRIIQKKINAKYIGCTHEYLSHDYGSVFLNTLFINDVSDGGSKSDKYSRDIKLLTKGIENEPANSRYYFYLGNSYRDNNQPVEAITQYEKVIELNGWCQEKYYSCYNIFICYSTIGNVEKGLYYLTKSYLYDDERPECIYELVKYYCVKKMDKMALKYYELIKDKYESIVLTTTFQDKLFFNASIAYFYFPYYLIISSINTQDFKTAIFMYEIIFKKKQKNIDKWFISNLISNYDFILKYKFTTMELKHDTPSYLDDLYKYVNDYSITHNYDIDEFQSRKSNHVANIYDKIKKDDKYKESNKILFYVGHSLPDYKWNKTLSLTTPMGGSEKALSYLIGLFPKKYDIYVCGDVVEEDVDNIHFIQFDKIKNLTDNNDFHTIIMSRYIECLTNYNFNCYKLYIWAHDTVIRSLATNPEYRDVNTVINYCENKLDGCICLTNWHKEYFSMNYKNLKHKTIVINNGIEIKNFPAPQPKIKNTFIYTSRSERGLHKVLELWKSISISLPDAHLNIASYNVFPDPNNSNDLALEKEMKKYSNITHLGKLVEKDLYDLMNTSEYWLYPTNFFETSCITAMEMLKSRVICLYYPIGGLVDTMNNHGIQLVEGEEVNQIIRLTESEKQDIIVKGEKYADTCSWENRYKQWDELLFYYQHNKMSQPKILNLILYSMNETSSDNEYYLKMIALQKEYMKSCGMTFYFYCYKEDLQDEYVIEDNMLYIKGTESFIPGILEKTIRAFEITKNLDYDILIRSNISTVIDYNNLQKILYKIPNDVVYAGGSCLTHNWLDLKSGIDKIYNIPFVLGTSIILKKQGVDIIIKNKHLLPTTIIDDFAIAILFNKLGHKVFGFDNYYRYNLNHLISDIIFYRNKNHNRNIDIINMQNIIEQIMHRTNNA